MFRRNANNCTVSITDTTEPPLSLYAEPVSMTVCELMADKVTNGVKHSKIISDKISFGIPKRFRVLARGIKIKGKEKAKVEFANSRASEATTIFRERK